MSNVPLFDFVDSQIIHRGTLMSQKTSEVAVQVERLGSAAADPI